MIILDTSLKSLQVALDATPSAEFTWTASYLDIDTATFAASAMGASDGTTSGNTPVTMVAAPSSGKARQVKANHFRRLATANLS